MCTLIKPCDPKLREPRHTRKEGLVSLLLFMILSLLVCVSLLFDFFFPFLQSEMICSFISILFGSLSCWFFHVECGRVHRSNGKEREGGRERGRKNRTYSSTLLPFLLCFFLFFYSALCLPFISPSFLILHRCLSLSSSLSLLRPASQSLSCV